MITRRSMNKAAVAQSIKPLEEYLYEQDQLLDNVFGVLQREYRAIKNRLLDELDGLAETKSSLMLQLQANDQRLKLHPETGRLSGDCAPRVNDLRSKLRKCKALNETNGKLITLSLAANRRLSSVLMGARDRLSRNMTYNDKGTTLATGPLRVNISA